MTHILKDDCLTRESEGNGEGWGRNELAPVTRSFEGSNDLCCQKGKDRIRPDFPGTVPVLLVLKTSVLVSRKIGFGTPKVVGLSKA
jgi:hypothetical protein